MVRALTRAEEKRVDMYEALMDAAVYEDDGEWAEGANFDYSEAMTDKQMKELRNMIGR